MGYRLPQWQRPLVWSQQQSIKFIESLWLGIDVGTFTVTQLRTPGPLDNCLIDGQQRMHALQQYFEDKLTVFGARYSEVDRVDQRGFEFTRHFHCYILREHDEEKLKHYYNTLNFSGTPHTKGQRA